MQAFAISHEEGTYLLRILLPSHPKTKLMGRYSLEILLCSTLMHFIVTFEFAVIKQSTKIFFELDFRQTEQLDYCLEQILKRKIVK